MAQRPKARSVAVDVDTVLVALDSDGEGHGRCSSVSATSGPKLEARVRRIPGRAPYDLAVRELVAMDRCGTARTTCARRLSRLYERSDLNDVRTSSTKSCGCSHAAK